MQQELAETRAWRNVTRRGATRRVFPVVQITLKSLAHARFLRF